MIRAALWIAGVAAGPVGVSVERPVQTGRGCSGARPHLNNVRAALGHRRARMPAVHIHLQFPLQHVRDSRFHDEPEAPRMKRWLCIALALTLTSFSSTGWAQQQAVPTPRELYVSCFLLTREVQRIEGPDDTVILGPQVCEVAMLAAIRNWLYSGPADAPPRGPQFCPGNTSAMQRDPVRTMANAYLDYFELMGAAEPSIASCSRVLSPTAGPTRARPRSACSRERHASLAAPRCRQQERG